MRIIKIVAILLFMWLIYDAVSDYYDYKQSNQIYLMPKIADILPCETESPYPNQCESPYDKRIIFKIIPKCRDPTVFCAILPCVLR